MLIREYVNIFQSLRAAGDTRTRLLSAEAFGEDGAEQTPAREKGIRHSTVASSDHNRRAQVGEAAGILGVDNVIAISIHGVTAGRNLSNDSVTATPEKTAVIASTEVQSTLAALAKAA